MRKCVIVGLRSKVEGKRNHRIEGTVENLETALNKWRAEGEE